jgi:hypothetical protein
VAQANSVTILGGQLARSEQLANVDSELVGWVWDEMLAVGGPEGAGRLAEKGQEAMDVKQTGIGTMAPVLALVSQS